MGEKVKITDLIKYRGDKAGTKAKIDIELIRSKIESELRERKLSKVELSKMANISHQLVFDFLNKDSKRKPSLENVLRIINALNLKIKLY
jgi:hypothetical protein